jgi:ligand-binding sensor domain-containing protein/signal transduction histidine kinase
MPVARDKGCGEAFEPAVSFRTCPTVTNGMSASTLVAPQWAFLFLHLLFAGIVQSQSAGGPDEGVRYARVNPSVVHLEVVNGTDIRFSRLSRTKGISQTRVVAIAQDERGFMWFATQYGLNRYDGNSLRQFKHVDADPSSVSDSYIRCLFKDREGRLWVCSMRVVVDRYDPTTESFIHYPLGLGTTSDYAGAPRDISQDGDGLLWISTGSGLYRLDPSTGVATGFHHRADDPASLSSDVIRSSGVDRNGTLWVATPEGLDAFNRSTGRVMMHVPLREPREPRELSFYEDRFGTFWIIHSSGEGLAVLDRQAGVLTRYSFAQHAVDPGLLTGVSSMVEDAEGQLWIGTQSDGLMKLEPKRLQATRYRNDPYNIESLAENRITTLALDREGDIWVGLGTSEPNHFAPHPGPFHALPFDAGNRDNLGEKLVDVLYEDLSGTLWVGTTGALNRYDRSTDSYQRIQLPGTGNSDVLSMVEDRTGAMWVGTSGQGLARIDLKTLESKLYRHRAGDPTSLSSDMITHLLIDRVGTLWAVTLDGLNRYDSATDRFRTFRSGAEGSASYLSAVEDQHGKLWVSGPGGMVHFDPATEQFVDFNEGLAAKGYSVLAASNDDIWAGTQNGLYRFDRKNHKTLVYTESEGLASNAVSCLLEDARGDVWMSTTEGVSRFMLGSDRFRNYSVEDGMPGRDMTGWSACSRGHDGELYFGGFAGAVAFDPKAVVDNPYTPQVALTGLELAGVPVHLGPGSPLVRAITYMNELRLSSSQRSFAIEYAALSFRSPGTNRYRYRLDGLDSSWHEVGGDRRVASYTTLPPGAYTFQVQAATNRGPWGEPGAALHITIEAPWWNRWQFRALLAAVALALAAGVYRYRVQRITRTLEIRFDERTRERTRIARDLHDSLLQGFQGLTLKYHALAHTLVAGSSIRTSMEANLRQARLLIEDVRTRVRDLRSPDEPQAAVEDLLRDFTDTLPKLSATAVQIRVIGESRPLDPIAFEEVLLIGREAISNAMTHAIAARIEAELTYKARELMLRVSDNGKGMDAKTLEAGRAGHWGLQGMRERAQSLGAVLEVWSRPGSGTDIQLLVPGTTAYGRFASGAKVSPIERWMLAIAAGRWPW